MYIYYSAKPFLPKKVMVDEIKRRYIVSKMQLHTCHSWYSACAPYLAIKAFQQIVQDRDSYSAVEIIFTYFVIYNVYDLMTGV